MKILRYPDWSFMLVILALSAFAWTELQWPQSAGSTELASRAPFEDPRTCGPERNYLQTEVAMISPIYRLSRSRVPETHIAKECVSYIMQNFVSLRSRSAAFATCPKTADGTHGEPTIGEDRAGNFPPCVTEEYVNSVYHSLVDVSDCLNIPMGELLPKLYNESGLHLNTLGGGFDAGIGQLTVSALREVYMSYNGNNRNPSSLDWYMAEIAKSRKPSCQRIAQNPDLAVKVPRGQRLCKLNEAADDAKRPMDQQTCYNPWSKNVRCVVMEGPTSPLRNVLYTGIFYRAMLRSATGLSYSAGQDILNSHPYTGREGYNGYIGSKNYVERIRRLGATGVTDDAVKQIIVSFGFNAGISTGNIFLDNYLKQKEANNGSLRDSDFDFQNISTGKWAIVTNLPTFWRGLGSDDLRDYQNALDSLEVLSEVGLDVKKAQSMYKSLRKPAFKERQTIEAMNISEKEKSQRLLKVKLKYDRYRKPLLEAVFAKSDQLTLPEFMRVAHAYKILTSPGTGGAPGYISFLANKHKQLDTEMGVGVCTSEKYLQF